MCASLRCEARSCIILFSFSLQICGLTLLQDTAIIGWWRPEDAVNLTTQAMDAQSRVRVETLERESYAAHLYTSNTGGLLSANPESVIGYLLEHFSLAQKHPGEAAAQLLPPTPLWNATAAALHIKHAAPLTNILLADHSERVDATLAALVASRPVQAKQAPLATAQPQNSKQASRPNAVPAKQAATGKTQKPKKAAAVAGKKK